MSGKHAARLFLAANAAALIAWAQLPAVITLDQAQQMALRNHPRIASATATAEASRSVVKEVRAAYFPTLSGNVTGVGAEQVGRFRGSADHIQPLQPRVDRFSASQLSPISGAPPAWRPAPGCEAPHKTRRRPTRALKLRSRCGTHICGIGRGIGSSSCAGHARFSTSYSSSGERIGESALRSTVDVSFAQVNVSQAELDLFRAESAAKASHARLSGAMGIQG